MKRVFRLMITAAVVVMTLSASAQMSNKELSKELKARVEKDCRKDAKQLTKDGWRTAPGALSLEKQLQVSRYAMLDKTADDEAVNIIATQVVTGANFSIAKGMGQSRAASELATKIKNEVKTQVENSIASQGVAPEEIQAVDQYLQKSSATASATLRDVETLFEVFRNVNGMVEYQITVAIDRQEALSVLKDALEKEMKSNNNAELWSKVNAAF